MFPLTKTLFFSGWKDWWQGLVSVSGMAYGTDQSLALVYKLRCPSVSVQFCQFLSFSVHFCLFLYLLACFCLFSFDLVCLCLFLSVCVHFCLFMSVYVCLCLFMSIYVRFCLFLSIHVRFSPFVFFVRLGIFLTLSSLNSKSLWLNDAPIEAVLHQ